MKSRLFTPGIILCCVLRLNAQQSSVHTPHLVKNGNFTQLLVDNKPFLILVSPFSIESTEHPEKEPIGKAYDVLKQVTHLVTNYQPSAGVRGFLLERDSSANEIDIGNYHLSVDHEYRLGWSAGAKNDTWPVAGCIIISVAPGEFYVAGTGVVITFTSTIANKRAGFLSIDEGKFIDKKWISGRRMNGDQDHLRRHVRIPVDS
jgi:hypothetical protein